MVNYFDELLRMTLTAAEGWATQQDPAAAGGRQTVPSAYGDLWHFMAQASLVWMNSGFRYWRGWSEIYASYSPVIMHSLQVMSADPSRSGEARGVLIDTLRAYCREMSELPWQESRRLQAELEKIVGQVWPAAAGAQEEPHRRQARVKL